jgi:hypothetical protein
VTMNGDLRRLIRGYLGDRTNAATPVNINPLGGGSHPVYRLSAGASRATWIAKSATASAERALKLLTDANIGNVPRLLASLTIDGGRLILLTDLPGEHGNFGDPVPSSVLRTLAKVHNRFGQHDRQHVGDQPAKQSRKHRLATMDAECLTGIIDTALGEPSHFIPDLPQRIAPIRHTLAKLIDETERFSHTLIHWDVHPGNILNAGDASSIIDWGSAQRGPAMLDLANLIAWGSADFETYIRERESIGGAIDQTDLRREFDWAVAVIQLKYLPFATKIRDHANTARMLGVVERYLASPV